MSKPMKAGNQVTYILQNCGRESAKLFYDRFSLPHMPHEFSSVVWKQLPVYLEWKFTVNFRRCKFTVSSSVTGTLTL